MSLTPKTQDQLLAELDAAVHPNGPLGKTTAPGLRAFLASLVADMLARSAAAGTGTGSPGTGTGTSTGGTGTGSPSYPGAVLASTTGLTYRLTVDNNGTLGAEPANGQPLTDPQDILTSPQGLLYRLTVAADGTLGTVPAPTTLDPDAVAFSTAAGLRSAEHQLAVNGLVRALKVGGIWPRLRAVYPMVGGTARAHALNLLDPRPLPEAFALQFFNNPTHSEKGVEWNGADQYANTGFSPRAQLSANSAHLAYYATTDSAASVQVEFGSYDNDGTGYLDIVLRHSDGYPYAYADVAGRSIFGPALPTGLGLGLSSYEPNGTATLYRDGRVQVQVAIATPTSAYPGPPLLLGRRQDGYLSQKACGFASVGAALTPAQVATYTEAIRAFQQALGREAGFDADALAFTTAAGLHKGTAPLAVNTLVRTLKATGVWPLLRAVYPMVGGTEQAHRLNLKDPRDADSAFRLLFYNSPQHTARGVEWNGINACANTFLVPSDHLDPTSHHLAYYAVTDSSPNALQVEIGSVAGDNQKLTMLMRHPSAGQGLFFESCGTTQYSVGLNHGLGFGLSVREDAATVAVYRDGRALPLRGTTNPGTTAVTVPIYLGARQDGLHSEKVCGFASVGAGLTPAQAVAYAAAVRAFQQALGRDVTLAPSLLLA
jgi:hypothetical protein